jgi:hypothetical protein
MLPAPTLLDSFKDTHTDARIVEEDDRYAVVAVRIDKTLIGGFMLRNLPFLAALAELKAQPASVLVGARPCEACPFARACDRTRCRMA